MSKSLIMTCILCALFAFTLPCRAGHFMGFGGGLGFGENLTPADGKKNFAAASMIAEYEYGGTFRDLWLLQSSLEYRLMEKNSSRKDLVLASCGIKYTPEYYFYKSNTAAKAKEYMGCLAFIFLPYYVARDALTDALQLILPRHPFLVAGIVTGTEIGKDFLYGYYIAPGFTSGYIDIKLKISHCFNTQKVFHQDFWDAQFELTFHFSFSGNPMRTAPLID